MTTGIKAAADGLSMAIQVGGVDRLTVDSTGNATLSASPAVGDNSKKVATTEFVAGTALGVGQTWQNVAGSRTHSTNYTNTTGKPIQVSIGMVSGGAGNSIIATINGVSIYGTAAPNSATQSAIQFIVPPGGVYAASISSHSSTTHWCELR